jgi:hypothetical protein
MLKKIMALLLVGLTNNIYACDICGCSAGSNSLGILPGFKSNFVGVRHQYRSFSSSAHEIGSNAMPSSIENYNTTEIWAKYMPTNRWQFFAFVPFHRYQRTENNKVTMLHGLGDISILSNYILINTGDSSKRNWKHALQVGGGIKLPTGRHNLLKDSLMVNPNLQPGTGSYDVMINAMYTLRYKKSGLHSEISYNLNNPNDQNFRFGNRYAVNLKYFYIRKTPQYTFLPFAGVGFETSDPNEINNEDQQYTASQSKLLLLGIDIYYKQVAIGFNYKKPISEYNSGGYVTTRQRIGAHLIFLF